MNLPFPSLTPKLVDSRWFNADNPCDEESEVSAIEQNHQMWLASVRQRYTNTIPLGKLAPEPMEEEAETDEEEGNDDSDDTEDTQDDEDDEEIVFAPGDDRVDMLYVAASSNNRLNSSPGNQTTQQVTGDAAAVTGDAVATPALNSTDNASVNIERVGNNNNDVIMNDGER